MVDSAEQIARVQGNGILLADVLRAKTFILYKTGRVDAARATFREAKNILESASNTWKTDGDGTTWVHIASGRSFRKGSVRSSGYPGQFSMKPDRTSSYTTG